jgi:adenylate cyclase
MESGGYLQGSKEKNFVLNNFKTSEVPLKLGKKLEDTVSFVGKPEQYSVGMVDMVNSTKISSKLSYEKNCLLYAIFLNSMSFIVEQFEGSVVKNVGDALLFYFPNTKNKKNGEFEKVLFCEKVMLDSHQQLMETLKKNNLPSIKYRITADYGTILMADSKTSFIKDLFGSPVNACFKMKSMTEPNSISIGSDFYQFVKDSENFSFRNKGICDLGVGHGYPVFQVEDKLTN